VPTTTALCQDADDYAKRLPADIDAGRDDMNDPAEEAARESAERVGIGTAAGFDLYNASLQANAEWSSMPLRLVSVDSHRFQLPEAVRHQRDREMGYAGQGERRIGRLTWFETAAQIRGLHHDLSRCAPCRQDIIHESE
jgi:hypothetical protein